MASFLASASQLLSLLAFVICIYFLNQRRPSGTNYKPFKLMQCLSILFSVMALFYLFQLIGGVEMLIEKSPLHVKNFISSQQGLCMKHREAGEYHLAEKAIRDRSLLKSLLKEEKYEAKQVGRGSTGGSGLLTNDWMNFLLFSTGVSVTVLPALVQLLFRIFIHSKASANANAEERQSHDAKLRREWGILLPIINHTTLLSFLTTFTFFLNIESQRSTKCIFTSGHWYTFVCTILTFAWIMSHLWSYHHTSPTAFRLLIVYTIYSALYFNFALSVLKNTQRYHHDGSEAHDGVYSAISVFPFFLLPLLLMQYILYQWSKTKPPRQARQQAIPDAAPPAYDQQQQINADFQPPAYSSAADAAAAPSIPYPPSSPSIPSPPCAPSSIPEPPEAPIAPPAPEAPIAPSAPSPPSAPPSSSSSSSFSANDLNAARSRLRASPAESKSSALADSSSDSGRPFSAADLQSGRVNLRPTVSRSSAAPSSDDSMMSALKARLAAARPFLEPGAEEDDAEWEVI